jgi:hypothetical protein
MIERDTNDISILSFAMLAKTPLRKGLVNRPNDLMWSPRDFHSALLVSWCRQQPVHCSCSGIIVLGWSLPHGLKPSSITQKSCWLNSNVDSIQKDLLDRGTTSTSRESVSFSSSSFCHAIYLGYLELEIQSSWFLDIFWDTLGLRSGNHNTTIDYGLLW